jgi:cation:H+ antiporter
MFISWIEIIAGLGLLVYGADRFVTGSAQISRIFKIPPLIIGLTIVGISTSVPEILVGTVAALDGKTHIAVGNAIGSNIANMSLVLGGAALFKEFHINSKTVTREYLVMMIVLFLGLLLMLDRYLDRIDACILLFGLVGFLVWTVYIARHARASDPIVNEIKQELPQVDSTPKSIVLLLGGLVVLFLGAETLIDGAVKVAEFYRISDLVIGLTIIAVGTSLPELAATIVAVYKDEADLAIGNIIGSNIFNFLAVLGIPVLIHPDRFGIEVLVRDLPLMLGLSVLLGGIILYFKKFNRLSAIVLLMIFAVYQIQLFMLDGN